MNLLLWEEHELEQPLPKQDPRAIHLIKVLHKKTGDTFDAGMIGGKRGKGSIMRIDAAGALFCSFNLTETPPPRLPIELAVGFPRPIQLRRILRELSNMGIAKIILFGTDSGEKSYQDTKLLSDGGARAALIEGAVQSRDTILPELAVYRNAADWLGGLCCGEKALVAADNVRPWGSFAAIPAGQRGFIIAIGSERGWSDTERALFERAGFRRLSLGVRALRTETAAAAAAALAADKLQP